MYNFVKTGFNKEILRMMNFSFGIRKDMWNPLEEIVKEDIKSGYCEIYAVMEEDRYVSAMHLLDFDMKLRNSQVRMAGIGGVVTSALYRGKGGVKFMLSKSLELMRERKYPVSVLYPFSIDFYRKYGWERLDDMITYHMPPSLIIKNGKSKDFTIEENLTADSETLEFYNNFAKTHYNLIQKTEGLWAREMYCGFPEDVDKRIVKFKKNGSMYGMFRLYMFGSDEDPKLICDNFAYLNSEAIQAMLEFLSSLSLQISEFSLNLPTDFDLWPYLSDRPKKIDVRQRSMIRVVDVMLLNGLKIDSPDFEINVEITDKTASWNEGIFGFRLKNGILEVVRTAAADIKCDISVLSSVVSGFTDFKSMYKAGKAEILNDSVFKNDFSKETTYLEFHF